MFVEGIVAHVALNVKLKTLCEAPYFTHNLALAHRNEKRWRFAQGSSIHVEGDVSHHLWPSLQGFFRSTSTASGLIGSPSCHGLLDSACTT